MSKTDILQQLLLLIAAAAVSSTALSVTAELGGTTVLGKSFIENGSGSRYWARLRQGDAADSIDYIKDLMQEFGPAIKSPSAERPTAALQTIGGPVESSDEVSVSNSAISSQETTSASSVTAPSVGSSSGNSQETSHSGTSSTSNNNNSQEISSTTSPSAANAAGNSQEMSKVGSAIPSSSNAVGNSQAAAPVIKRVRPVSSSHEIRPKPSASSSVQSQEGSSRAGSNSANSQEMPSTSSVNSVGNSQEMGSSASPPVAVISQEVGIVEGTAPSDTTSPGNSLEVSSQVSPGGSSAGNSQEVSSSFPSSASNILQGSSAASGVSSNDGQQGSVSREVSVGGGTSGNSHETSGGATASNPESISGNSQEVSGSNGNNAGSASGNSQEVSTSATGSAVASGNSQEVTAVVSHNRSAGAPRQLGPGSPLTAAVMLGAPILAGALYAGASAPHAPGQRRQDPDATGDEPYWQRLLQRTVGNLRDTASYVEGQVRDFFELEQSNEKNAAEFGGQLGVVPGGAPPGLVQFNQNQVLQPLRMNHHGAGNLPFRNSPLTANGGLHLRIPYIDGVPVFQNIKGLEQVGAGGQLERGETVAGKLPESFGSVRQETNPLLNPVGTPFRHSLNSHHLLGNHGSTLNNPILSQGMDPVLQRLIASRQAGLSIAGQIQPQLPYGGQSLPSEQFVRVAETGQVVPLRALHPQILDGLTHPDSVPARRFDGALSRQLNGPGLLNVPGVVGQEGSVRRMDDNPTTLISDRRTGLSPKDSDSTPVNKIFPSSLNFLGVGNGSPPGRRKGPLQTPGLQVVNGTVQYKADNGKSYLLGVTAGNEKMKRRKRPGTTGKNKKRKLKNQGNGNPNFLTNSLRANLFSANPSLNARNQQLNPFLPQVTSTFAVLPETKAEDFQVYDPLTVQLRSYNHKYSASEEERRAREDAKHSSYIRSEPKRNSFQEDSSRAAPTESKSRSSESHSNFNENSSSTVTSTPYGNYTTRFRVIDMDLKTQLRIAKEKLNISDLQSVRTMSKSYGDLKPETLITPEDLRSINDQSTNFSVMKSNLQRFASKELIEHHPPNQTPKPEVKSSPADPLATDFLDKRNHLVIGGGLHRKVADPQPLPPRNELKEQHRYTGHKVDQKSGYSLYRDDFSEHPHLSPMSREALLRMSKIDRLITLDKYRANAEKELQLRGLNGQNKYRPTEQTTLTAKREMGKVSLPQMNFDYRNHGISSVASSTVPSRSFQKTSGTNRPAEYPFYKFKTQTSKPPKSIQDVIAQTMGTEPALISSKRDRNSLEFNRFRNYNSRSPEYERRDANRFSNEYSYDENLDRLPLSKRPSSIEPEKKTIQGSLYHTYKNRKQYEHGSADQSVHDEKLRKIPGVTEDSALTIQPASFEVFDIITDKNKKKNMNGGDPRRFSNNQGHHEMKDYRTRSSYEYGDRLRESEESPIRYRTKNYDSFLTDESREAQRSSGRRTRNNEKFISKETRADYVSGHRSKYSTEDYPEVNDRDKYTSRPKYNFGHSSANDNTPDHASHKSPVEDSYEDAAYDGTPGLRRRKIESNSRRPFRKWREEVPLKSADPNGYGLDDENESRSLSLDRNNAPNVPRKSLSAELEDYIRTKTKLPPSPARSNEHTDSDHSLERESPTEATENYSSGPLTRRRRKPVIRRRNRFRSSLNSRNSNDDLPRSENFSSQGYGRKRRPVENPMETSTGEGSDVPPYAEDYTNPESRYRTKGLGRDAFEAWYKRRKLRQSADRTAESEAQQKQNNERRFYPEDEDMSVSPSVKHESTRTFMGIKRNIVSKFTEEKSKYDSTVEMLKAKRDAIGPKDLNEQPQKKIQSSIRSPFLPSDAIRNKVKRNDGESKDDVKPKEPQVITLEDVSGDHSGAASRKSFNSPATPPGPSFLKRIQDLSKEDDPIISNLKAVFLENANDHQKPVRTSFWTLDAPRVTEPVSVFNTPAPVSFTQKRKSVIRRKKIRKPEFSLVSRMGLPLNSAEIITGKISQSNLPRQPHQRQHNVFSNNKLSSNTAPNLSITEGSEENKEEQYESLSDLMPMRLVAPQPENLNSVASTEQVENNFEGKTVDFSSKVSTEDVRSGPFERVSAGAASGSTEHKGQMVYGESFSANQMRSEDLGRFSSASSDVDRGLVPIGEIKLPGSSQKILVETAVPEFFQSGPGSVINVLRNRGSEQVPKATGLDESSNDGSNSVDELSIRSEKPHSSTLDSSLLSFSSISVPVPEAKTFRIDEDSTLIGQLSHPTKKDTLRTKDKDIISAQNNDALGEQESGDVSSDQLGETRKFPKTDTEHFIKEATPARMDNDDSKKTKVAGSENLLNANENSEVNLETLGKIREESKQNKNKDASLLVPGASQLMNVAPAALKDEIIPTAPVKKITIS